MSGGAGASTRHNYRGRNEEEGMDEIFEGVKGSVACLGQIDSFENSYQ